MDNIRVNIEKSLISLLWLDISILIKIAKSKAGEKNSD